jgi:Domain of unknown function (DUF4304)
MPEEGNGQRGTRRPPLTPERAPARTGAVSAQQAFEHLMRDLVAPTLHDLGFKGAGPRIFRYRSGDYGAAVTTQKSTASNREQVRFWVHLTAAYLPTNSTYWTTPLHALIPANTSFTSWTIRADAPAEPVAENLLSVFLDNGWPAIQAALDSPGYPPDPAATWARTFPAEPAAGSPPQVEHTRPFRPSGRRNDHLLAELGHPDATVRTGAAAEIGARALRHPQAIPTLLDHLEHDPRRSG